MDSNIFSNQTTDATSTEFKVKFGTRPIHIYINGVLGNATVLLESESPDGLWEKVYGGELSELGMYIINSGPFTGRMRIVGADAETDVTVWLSGQVSLIEE